MALEEVERGILFLTGRFSPPIVITSDGASLDEDGVGFFGGGPPMTPMSGASFVTRFSVEARIQLASIQAGPLLSINL